MLHSTGDVLCTMCMKHHRGVAFTLGNGNDHRGHWYCDPLPPGNLNPQRGLRLLERRSALRLLERRLGLRLGLSRLLFLYRPPLLLLLLGLLLREGLRLELGLLYRPPLPLRLRLLSLWPLLGLPLGERSSALLLLLLSCRPLPRLRLRLRLLSRSRKPAGSPNRDPGDRPRGGARAPERGAGDPARPRSPYRDGYGYASLPPPAPPEPTRSASLRLSRSACCRCRSLCRSSHARFLSARSCSRLILTFSSSKASPSS